MIGLPSEINWPENTTVLRSSFEPHPQISLKTVIPGICSEEENVLTVRFIDIIL